MIALVGLSDIAVFFLVIVVCDTNLRLVLHYVPRFDQTNDGLLVHHSVVSLVVSLTSVTASA